MEDKSLTMREDGLSKYRDEVRRECLERGIAIIPTGASWWLVGDGVDCVVTDLALVTKHQMKSIPVLEH